MFLHKLAAVLIRHLRGWFCKRIFFRCREPEHLDRARGERENVLPEHLVHLPQAVIEMLYLVGIPVARFLRQPELFQEFRICEQSFELLTDLRCHLAPLDFSVEHGEQHARFVARAGGSRGRLDQSRS